MPTPRAGYFTRDGRRVPGTTTIIGRFKESGGLLQWAFKQGQEGKSHLYEEAEKAAGIGTVVHTMVEAHIKGNAILVQHASDEAAAKASSAFNAYLAWSHNFGVRIIEQEIQLVCEEYLFGGTPDALGFVGNQLCLLDWKTSNGVYSDYLIQLAAYGHLWNVNRPDSKIEGGFHLLRFSKEHGDFAHHYFPDLSEAWEQFVLFRRAYDIDKTLKKRAA